MMSLNKLTVVLVAISIMLTGCVTSTGSLMGSLRQRDHVSVVNIIENDKHGYSEYLSWVHWDACKSFIMVGQYDGFFDCHKALEEKVALNNGKIIFTNDLVKTEINQAGSIALMTSSLALVYFELRDYEKALEYAHEVEALLDSGAVGFSNTVFSENFELNTWSGIPTFGVLATVYGERGDREKSLRYLRRMNSLRTDDVLTRRYEGERRDWATRAYMAVGDYASAYREVTNNRNAFGDSLAPLADLFGLPVKFLVTGDARTQQQAIVARQFRAKFLLHELELKLGKLEQAKQGYDEILAYPGLDSFGYIKFNALYGRGLVASGENETDKAIDYFKQAVEVIEQQRSSIKLEQQKIGFVGDKIVIYRELIAALIKVGRIKEAFEYAERAKARALVDLLASKKSFGSGAAGETTAKVLAELEQLELASQGQVANAGTGSASRGIQQVMSEFTTTDPETASLVSVATAETATIQSQLRADEALVEYFYQGDGNKDAENLFAFVVTRSGIKAVMLDTKDLNSDVRSFRRAIKDYQSDDWAKWSARLHDRLIKPLDSAIAGRQHLTIVPHGALHYLPFNALKAKGGKFLIEEHTVRLLPSASVMQFLNKGKAATEGLLVFGNPDLKDASLDLPGAQQEARAIARLWPGSKVVLRNNASESVIKKSASAFKYLHLASHGQFNSANPLKSRMLLAPDNDNDGNLTVPEIYDLKLNADMVVLSACQTALGDVKNGDDVVGLNRGFLYAGAKSIVGSLWEVPDDPTRDLMVTLYRNLKKMDLRKAMQQAQLSTIKKYKHPIAWAAFQVTGGG